MRILILCLTLCVLPASAWAEPTASEPSATEARVLDMLERTGETLNAWVETGSDFASEQAPELAREVVAYGVIYHGVKITYGAVLLLICQLVIWRFSLPQVYKGFEIVGERGNRYKRDEEMGPIFRGFGSLALGTIFSVVGCSMVLNHSLVAAKALVAPRLYLIEQIARLF